MGRKPSKLTSTTAQRADLQTRLNSRLNAGSRQKIRAVLLAMNGECSLDEIARITGRARSTIQLWLKRYEDGGTALLLKRKDVLKSSSPIAAEGMQHQLKEGLRKGQWSSAAEIARWLQDVHGIKRARKSIYYWMRKLSSPR